MSKQYQESLVKERNIESILAVLPFYTPESQVYQNFDKWLQKQSVQNIFLIRLIAFRTQEAEIVERIKAKS